MAQASMIVLVDTPIWSLAFRRKRRQALAPNEQEQLQSLEQILSQGRVRLLGAIRQELLSGIRSSQEFARLREHLRSFPDVELETEDYEHAAETGNRCRSHGVAVSPVDMLLCSVALRRNWAIYTLDRNFTRYAKHVPIVLLP